MRSKISKLLFLALAAPSGVLLLSDSNTAVAATDCRWLMTEGSYLDGTAKCVAVGKYEIPDEGRAAWSNFVTQTDNSGPWPDSANSFTLYHGKKTSSREDKCSPDSTYFYRVGNLVVGNNHGSSLSNGLGSLGNGSAIPAIGLDGIYNPNATNDDPLYRVSSDSNVHTKTENYLRNSIIPSYGLGQNVKMNGADVGRLVRIMSISEATRDGLLSNWDKKSNYVFCHESEKQFVSLSPEVDFGFLDGAMPITPDAAERDASGNDYFEINRNMFSVKLSLIALESDSLSGFVYKKSLLDEADDGMVNRSITINLTNTSSVGTSWSYKNPGLLQLDGDIHTSIGGPYAAKYVTVKITYPKRFYKDENGIIAASDEKYVKFATIYLAGDNSCSKWAFDNPDTMINAHTFGAAASATTSSFGYIHNVKNKDQAQSVNYPVLYVGPNDNPYFRLFYCNGGTAAVSGSNSRFVGFSGTNAFSRPTGNITIGAGTGQSLLYSKDSTKKIEYGQNNAMLPYYMRSARPNTSSTSYGVYIEKPYNYVIIPTVQISTGSTGGQVPKGSKVSISATANILARKNSAVNPSVAYATLDGGIKTTRYYYRVYTTNNPTSDAKPHAVTQIPSDAQLLGSTSGDQATVNGSAGEYFCARVYVTPADSHDHIGSINGTSTISFGSDWGVTGSGGNSKSGTSIMVSAPSCVTIGDYSRIHAENSSIYVNGQIKTLSPNSVASSVDYSIIARGKVSTPSIVAGGDASNPNSQQILKKEAGKPGSAPAASGEIGRTVSLIKMRYANQGASTINTINDSYLGTVGCVQDAGTGKWTKQFTTPSYDCSNDGVVRIHASDNAQIEALTIRKNIAIISSGNVTIAGNIGIVQNETNPSTLVNAIISANNITIKSNVRSINAWLIADSSVNTCDKTPTSADDCSLSIVFNGPVVANNVNLLRTTGSSGVAETFAPDVFDYYWANEKSDVGDLLKTTYIKEYSPRY